MVFLSAVNRLKTIVAMMLLAVWLPATSHCLLEIAGVIHESDCCANAQGAEEPGHDAADGNCQIEAGNYRLPKPGSFVLSPVFMPCLSLLLVSPALDLTAPVPGFGANAPPPELPVSWCFLWRTALPARAPSRLA
ncbi:MAG: hypothetical protein HZA89_03810 [Verrucomicrobia bacterium]|nr:hypothetical protein [Verrucomicrobiota bacterium]